MSKKSTKRVAKSSESVIRQRDKFTLVRIDRETLAIEYETSHYNEAKITRLYWPIGHIRKIGVAFDAEDAIGKEAKSHSDGVFSVYMGNGNSLSMRLVNGGSTQPIEGRSVTFDPPRPKNCRLELRWLNGAWEKYSKQRGWIAA